MEAPATRPLMGTTPLPPRPQLVQNAVWIAEEDVYLKSSHQHDYVSHSWTDSKGVPRHLSIDGGCAYVKKVGDFHLGPDHLVDWCLYEDSPFEAVAEALLWGTFGPKGDQPLRWRPISTLELNHLIAIRDTQHHISPLTRRVVEHWIDAKILSTPEDIRALDQPSSIP